MPYIVLNYVLLLFFPIIKKDAVKKIEIRKMDFSIRGVVPMGCDFIDKEDFFVDTFFVTKRKDIELFVSNLKLVTPVSNEFDGVEARAKIYLYYTSNKIDSLCIGTTEVFFYNDKLMLMENRKIVDFVRKIPMTENLFPD